jgi:hypothetical protein
VPNSGGNAVSNNPITPAPVPADAQAEAERRESGRPGGGQGRVEVTGVVPEGVRIDPDLTEGHPGYQESGNSEVIPNDRLAGGGGARK